jgi:hypothetical protein
MIAAAPGRRRALGVSGAIVLICSALTISVSGVHYVKALSQLDDTASFNSSLSFEDREIAGGNSVIVDQRAAYEARALIPVADSYRVSVGGVVRGMTELTQRFVAPWFTYFLMPRRPLEHAPWVICYGCDTATLRNGYEIRWRDRYGISIGYVP